MVHVGVSAGLYAGGRSERADAPTNDNGGKRIRKAEVARESALSCRHSERERGGHKQLVRFLGCSALFRVGDERLETRVSMQRFELRIFIHVQFLRRAQPVVHGLA